LKILGRVLLAAVAIVAVIAIVFAINVLLGMHAHARVTGTISGLRVGAPVSILRDSRGVPHILALSDRDAFFAQGYVQGSDRLFQMDLLRRFTLGELSEIFGTSSLQTDQAERAIPIRNIVETQWRRLDVPTRELLGAFSDGVNAAIEREPLPVEFRLLAYRPRPWTPQDSLAVGMATVLDLTDDWDAVASRDAAYRRGGLALLAQRFPLTDPCYDAPVLSGLGRIAAGPRCNRNVERLVSLLAEPRAALGSNEWAAGANRTLTHRSLLANDPHLSLGIPGVWYLVDLHSPHYHASGVSLPGLPAVVLGHNEHIAWGATAGTVTSLSVFEPPANLDPAGWHTERIAVRFHATASARYYRTARLFGVTTRDGHFVLVRWSAYRDPVSPAQSFIALDRAASIEAAAADLAHFPGPSLNFVLADTSGRAAYLLAGQIPNDPVRARWIHPARDLKSEYPAIPFAQLPKVAGSRDAVVWTANNKMYGAGYPFALSPQFAPPYRAYRIAELLRARARYDVPYFMQMQMDALSLPERGLAQAIAPAVAAHDVEAGDALARWNGEMTGDSTAATIVAGLRSQLTHRKNGRMPGLLANAGTLRTLPAGIAVPSPEPWRLAGAVTVRHALAALGLTFLDGTTLPGYGDAFTLHVQTPGYSQSFRAVWDVGNWDAGGITLPQGESGEPGSGHYTDQADAWVQGRLWPLPFNDATVQRTAAERQLLLP